MARGTEHTGSRNPDGRFSVFQWQHYPRERKKGAYAGVEIIDIADIREPLSGSMTVLLSDGSVSNQTFEGEVTFKESANRVSGFGTWKMIGGTGRFGELRGGGEFNWAIYDDKLLSE